MDFRCTCWCRSQALRAAQAAMEAVLEALAAMAAMAAEREAVVAAARAPQSR